MLTSATLPFLATLLAALILAVFSMLHGIRRPETDAPVPIWRRAMPSLSAGGITFGVVGYLLTSHTSLAPLNILLGALILGIVVTLLMARFISRWALNAIVDSAVEEAEELQGQIGTVVRDILPGGQGEITYELHGRRFSVPALTIDGSAAPAGTEVVIDRIESGVASVEPWQSVELRL
jgi:membrane protein implicated in regulation of membrane protease activity